MSKIHPFLNWSKAVIFICVLSMLPASVFGDEGDADLAKAKELQAKIQSIDDMEKVAELCESAIEKGLGDDAKKEANKIWAEVLYQQAVDRQLSVRTRRDLEDVAALCQEAVEKGLDKETETAAKGMWASSLYQYGEQLSLTIFTVPPDPRWRFYRTQAMSRLEEAIEVNPNYAEAHLLIARLSSLEDGDYEKAEKHAEKAIELAGDSTQIKAQAYVMLAMLAKAPSKRERLFAQALEADPMNELALKARADRNLQENKVKEAIKDYEKLAEINDKNLGTHVLLTRAYIADKQYEQALEQSAKALKLVPEDSDQASLFHSMRGQAYLLSGNKESATEELDKSIAIKNNNVDALLLRAQVHLENEDYDPALKDVNRVLKIDNRLVGPYLMRSYIYAGQEKFDAAIMDMQLLAQAAPGNPEYVNQLGYLCNASDRPRKAVEFFTQVLRRDKKNIQALRGRGDSYLSYGDHKKAIADYKAALEIDPDNSGVLNNYAWVLATTPDDDLRDGKLATELAEKACKLTENKQAHILSTLASGYAETGDFENAKKWAAKAIETSDNDEQKKGLREELESYEQGKPWREKEEVEEGPWPPKASNNDDEDIDS